MFRSGLTLLLLLILIPVMSCAPARSEKAQQGHASQHHHEAHHDHDEFPVQRTEAQWQEILPPKTFEVMRHEATERAFSHPYDKNKEDGVYYCASCGQPLFDSKHKYNSGTGWPSFYQPIKPENVGTRQDTQFFMVRTEVHCSRCGGHLGHVFDDGPRPTNLRYCMNGAALNFKRRGLEAPTLLK